MAAILTPAAVANSRVEVLAKPFSAKSRNAALSNRARASAPSERITRAGTPDLLSFISLTSKISVSLMRGLSHVNQTIDLVVD